MIESNNWRVRVEANDTVADVCKRLSNKIDEKYKVLELYLIKNRMCEGLNYLKIFNLFFKI